MKKESNLASAIDMISRLLSSDFSKSLPVKSDSSELDQLAIGLNRLAAELKNSVEAKKDLAEKNSLIEAIVENIPVAIFLKDANDDFRFKLWNQAAEKIFEIEREDILGKTTHDLFDNKSADLYTADDQRVIESDKPLKIAEEPAHTKLRGEILCRTIKIPIRASKSSNHKYLLGICEDITDEKATHAAMIHSAKLASLGEMAAGIAHEINNPLAIIHGKARSLHRTIASYGDFAEPCLQDINQINDTCLRISRITKGLSAFARKENSEEFVRTKLRKIIETVVGMAIEKFKSSGVELRLGDIPDVEFDCREVQITQVLVNLLSNAFDAIQSLPLKWVSLEAIEVDKHINFIVTDSGNGIPKEIADKLMQPFFTTKPVGQGTGLGLSISKGIAEDHHGFLRYEYNSKNTQFIMSIPKSIKPITVKAAG